MMINQTNGTSLVKNWQCKAVTNLAYTEFIGLFREYNKGNNSSIFVYDLYHIRRDMRLGVYVATIIIAGFE